MRDTSRPVRLVPILLCLGLIAIYPFMSSPLHQVVHALAPGLGEVPARYASEGVVWVYAALVLAIALYGEPRTLASIGLVRPTLSTPLWGLGAAVALILSGAVASFIVYNVLHYTNRTPAEVEAITHGSLVYGLVLAARAGVIEEVFYRGIAIEQLTVLTGRRWLGALIATLVFVVSHALHFEIVQLVPVATLGFALAAIYLWRRNLWINIIGHFAVDAIAFTALALHLTKLY